MNREVILFCVCVERYGIALCNEGTALWEQLVSGVSVQYPHLNFVLMSNSGAAFGPKLKDKEAKTDL